MNDIVGYNSNILLVNDYTLMPVLKNSYADIRFLDSSFSPPNQNHEYSDATGGGIIKWTRITSSNYNDWHVETYRYNGEITRGSDISYVFRLMEDVQQVENPVQFIILSANVSCMGDFVNGGLFERKGDTLSGRTILKSPYCIEAHNIQLNIIPYPDYNGVNPITVGRLYLLFGGQVQLNTVRNLHVNYVDNILYPDISSTEYRSANAFNACRALVDASDIYIPLEKVSNCGGMFTGCTNLTILPKNLSRLQFNTDISGLFSGCSSLTGIDFNLPESSYYISVFSGCTSLLPLGINQFNPTFHAVCQSCFSDCISLGEIPAYHIEEAIAVDGMFGRESFTYPLNTQEELILPDWEFTELQSMSNVLYGCNIKTIPDWKFYGNLLFCNGAFKGCRKVESGITRIYNTLNAINPTYHSECFTNCGIDTTTGAAELAQIPSSWGGTGA